MFTTRAFNTLRQYPSPTTVFTLPILLLLAFCFYRTTHDLDLVQLLVPHSELVLLQRRAAAAQPRRRSKKQRSVTPLTSVVKAPVDVSASKNATTLPTKLHHMSGQYQRDSGCATMGVSVIFVAMGV